MKAWMIRSRMSGYYVYRKEDGGDSAVSDDIWRCDLAPLTPSNWRRHDWYVLDSKEAADWYRGGLEHWLKESKRNLDVDKSAWTLQVVEVDISFNGFTNPELTRVAEPPKDGEKKASVLEVKEEEVKPILDRSIKILMDMVTLAERADSPTTAALSLKVMDNLDEVRKILCGDEDDGGAEETTTEPERNEHDD